MEGPTEETFKADGTGAERHFTSNRGVVQNERIVSFEWLGKSEVYTNKVSNGEEGDVPFTNFKMRQPSKLSCICQRTSFISFENYFEK